jgi:glutamine amidotransferase
MQLVASTGLELGEHPGLDWTAATVRRFENNGALRVPHVGWNNVKGRGALFRGIPEDSSFYFVHSFYFDPVDASIASGCTDYGLTFTSAIEFGNVYGVQFHPEKSHRAGIALLQNFVRLTMNA